MSVRIVSKLLGISMSQFSLLFTTWVNFLAYELEGLIKLTAKEPALRGAAAFKNFPITQMVIECTEIFAERPSGLKARQPLFSNYKHHVTIKFLVGCSMNGEINFVSSAWGGRGSDKKITCELPFTCQALMADHGFLVEDAAVTQAKRIARARIHIEQAIQIIKVFTILRCVPLSLLHVCVLSKRASRSLSSQTLLICNYLTLTLLYAFQQVSKVCAN